MSRTLLIALIVNITPFLLAECWMPHDRPYNSVLARDSEKTTDIPKGKTLTLMFLDDFGKPIPHARFSYYGNPKPHSEKEQRHYAQANSSGIFTIYFKPGVEQKSFVMEIDHPGFAPFHAEWVNPETDPVPAEYTIKLEKAKSGGGRVLDDKGEPLVNADVEFCIRWENRTRTPQICSYRVWVKTDENGFWSFDLLPPNQLPGGTVYMHVDFKGFMPYEKETKLSDFLPDESGNFTHVAKLERGETVKGRITDTERKPISGAIVFGNYMSTRDDFTTKTNENGEYTLENWPESEEAYIGVWSPEKMSTLIDFTVKKGNVQSIDVVMQPAKIPLKVNIVDKDGKPIPNFSLAIERWGKHRLVNPILLHGKPNWAKTDANGCWIWKEAPESEVVFDMMKSEHYMDLRNRALTARTEEYVFTSPPALRISGNVLDANSGEPISEFKVFLGIGFDNSENKFSWEIKAGAGKDGRYSINETFERAKFAVKIDAEGYESAISRDVQKDEGAVSIDFSLKKLSAEKLTQTLQGTVLAPDGTPAENATLAIATIGFQHRPYIADGRIRQAEEPFVAKTDNTGKFKFSFIDFDDIRKKTQGPHYNQKSDVYALYILHHSGFKRVTQSEIETVFKDTPITLEKWGRIEGIAKVGTKKRVQSQTMYQPLFSDDAVASWHCSATSDDEGRFIFENVPVGPGMLFVGISTGKITHYSDGQSINVLAGETTTAKIGGVGRPVTGNLAFETQPDWMFCSVSCSPENSKEQFRVSKHGTVTKDGVFRIDDVPEGDWQLRILLNKPSKENPHFGMPIGQAQSQFKIPAIPNGVSDEPLDIGAFVVQKISQRESQLKVGQKVPDFELQKIDSSVLRWSDFKDKIVVVDFWGTWCGPCVQKIPSLRKVYELIKKDPRFAMLGVCFEPVESLETFVAENDMQWTHGVTGKISESKLAKDFGLQGIPWLLLIGSDGRVLLSNPSVEELYKKIEELLE